MLKNAFTSELAGLCIVKVEFSCNGVSAPSTAIIIFLDLLWPFCIMISRCAFANT